MIRGIFAYINEFHRKKLVTFDACKQYYDQVDVSYLLSEALWLLGNTTKALPIHMIMPRCYALFNEMTERATCWSGFSDAERTRFIDATIQVKEEILRRAPPATREDLLQQIRRTCRQCKKDGPYKKASDLIRDSIRNYPGPFSSRRIVVVHPGSKKMQ